MHYFDACSFKHVKLHYCYRRRQEKARRAHYMTPTSALDDLERRHVAAPHDLDLITDCTQCTLERAHVSPYVPHKMRATASAAATPLFRGLCDSSSGGGTGGGGGNGRVDCDDVTSSDTEAKDYTAFLQQQNSKNAGKQQSQQQPQQQQQQQHQHQQQQRYKVNFSSNLTDFYERPKFN